MTQFTQAELCAAAGIKPELLRVRRSRGQYNLGSGDGHRRFTFIEVYQTAVMLALETIGIAVDRAYSRATDTDLEDLLLSLHIKVIHAGDTGEILQPVKPKNYMVARRLFEEGSRSEIGILSPKNYLPGLGYYFYAPSKQKDETGSAVASASFIQIEAIVANCFARLPALYECTEHLQSETNP